MSKRSEWSKECVLSIWPVEKMFSPFFPPVSALRSIKMSTIIVVSPLVSVMRDQVEQLERFGFSAAAIGIGEKCVEDEEKVKKLSSEVPSPECPKHG